MSRKSKIFYQFFVYPQFGKVERAKVTCTSGTTYRTGHPGNEQTFVYLCDNVQCLPYCTVQIVTGIISERFSLSFYNMGSVHIRKWSFIKVTRKKFTRNVKTWLHIHMATFVIINVGSTLQHIMTWRGQLPRSIAYVNLRKRLRQFKILRVR